MKNANMDPFRQSEGYSPVEESEILKLALEQVNIQVFVYDILLKQLYFFNRTSLPFEILKQAECTVEEILAGDIVEPEYTEAFRELFEKIVHGEKNSEARIKFSNGTQEIWNHIVLFNCFCGGKSPARAIGTMQDISRRVEAELLYGKEKQYRMAMLADSRRVYEINVTRDRFIRLESIQDTTDYGTWEVYTEAMNYLRKTKVYREDWEIFLEISTRENLLKGFQEGRTEFYCEYRTVGEDGTISWSSSATHLLKDPLSDDIKGFIYVKNIDEQKKREIALAQQAECDSLTGIYNRRTAEKLISQILSDSDPEVKHAFLTIDLDDFKSVNDTYGHATGDLVLQQLAQKIQAVVRDGDIIARLGGDEFIVFLKDTADTDRKEAVAELICSVVRTICVSEESSYHPSVSIGIAAYPEDGITFKELYENSDQALYYVKKHGKNGAGRYT